MKAIALLEVQAMVAAITGLDAMVKAADVKLIHVEKRLGGRLVTVVVEGEVSAVTAALEAGAAHLFPGSIHASMTSPAHNWNRSKPILYSHVHVLSGYSAHAEGKIYSYGT